MNEQEIEKYCKFLKEIDKISLDTNEPANIFKICGFPHYEDVCSNILAFFFCSQKGHGLKNLFAKALFETINVDFNEITTFTADTQIVTDNQNRIDILITSDDYNIIIENKIFNPKDNPLDDYNDYVKKNYGENVIVIVLGLEKKEMKCSVSYKSITYSDFFANLKKHFGDYISDINQKYSVLLFDFINNIESLIAKPMNTELVKFFADEENLKMHKNMQEKVKELNGDLMQIANDVCDLVNNMIAEMSFDLKLECYTYPKARQNNDTIYATVVLDIKDGTKTFAIDSTLTPIGWFFSGYNRHKKKFKDIEKTMKEQFKGGINELCRYQFEEIKPFNLSKEEVAQFIYEIINVLLLKQEK